MSTEVLPTSKKHNQKKSNTLTTVLWVFMILSVLPPWSHFTLPSVLLVFIFLFLNKSNCSCCGFLALAVGSIRYPSMLLPRVACLNLKASEWTSAPQENPPCLPPLLCEWSTWHHIIDAIVLATMYNSLSVYLCAPEWRLLGWEFCPTCYSLHKKIGGREIYTQSFKELCGEMEARHGTVN